MCVIVSVLLSSTLLAGAGSADSVATESLRYSGTVSRAYDDVVEDVKFAISTHNFRITGGNDIGGAIAKRHSLDFPSSEIVHFCNLEYARQLIELMPEFILHMPCKVTIREQDDHVVVETQLLPANQGELGKLSQEVNIILKAIVDEATE